ncbi:MAG: hypothetical protein COA52_09670 [Hyphomicrobiales bacterium]|nr:MAG: hypothetical protein COA52_09670 [Hyphomicrobiales bacterium]
MNIIVKADERCQGDVLELLKQNQNVHQIDDETLSHDSTRCLTLRDDGKLMFACAWTIAVRGPHKWVDVIATNGQSIKGVKWLPALVETLDRIAEAAGAKGICVPVSREALSAALEKLNYHPAATMLMRLL